jgi:RNA polymerase sigma-70 factor (ECF subfamily)
MENEFSEDDDTSRLARSAAKGDRAAAEELLERHLPELRAFVRLRTGEALRSRESTSDLVQSTCREVLANMERFQFPNGNAFKRWLFTTAHRKLADRADHWGAAKRGGGREEPLTTPSGDEDARLLACYQRFSSPSHRALVQDELERIERAFDKLTEEQRELITLAHVAGLPRSEIAEQVGKSEAAVRVALHRALARLAEVVREV